MKEILLTSSALILALLVLRLLFRNRISPAGSSTPCGCWCWRGC